MRVEIRNWENGVKLGRNTPPVPNTEGLCSEEANHVRKRYVGGVALT